jgi:hypothetical protein
VQEAKDLDFSAGETSVFFIYAHLCFACLFYNHPESILLRLVSLDAKLAGIIYQ